MSSLTSFMDFNVVEEDFLKLHQNFLALATRTSTKSFEGLKILSKQTVNSEQPPEWILVDLVALDGATSTLAVRDDNLYVVAFTNGTYEWYTFGWRQELIAGSASLSFTGDYNDHDGLGNREDIDQLPPGRISTIQAIHTLVIYNSGDVQNLKHALSTLMLTISEAARFSSIHDIVRAGWETQGQIARTDVLTHWGKLTFVIVHGWSRAPVRRYEKFFELKNGKESAKAVLNVLQCARSCEDLIDNLPRLLWL